MNGVPKNTRRKYRVDERGRVFMNFAPAGQSLLASARLLLPTPSETRVSLLTICKRSGLSRAQVALVLGITAHTLRRWEDGTRIPSAAGRRLVQLIEGIFFCNESKISGIGTILVGHVDLDALRRIREDLLPSPGQTGFADSLATQPGR